MRRPIVVACDGVTTYKKIELPPGLHAVTCQATSVRLLPWCSAWGDDPTSAKLPYVLPSRHPRGAIIEIPENGYLLLAHTSTADVTYIWPLSPEDEQ